MNEYYNAEIAYCLDSIDEAIDTLEPHQDLSQETFIWFEELNKIYQEMLSKYENL